ncbi:hypothetical protein [Burkholderia cenocepacia]|uniref:hypothetical protein n=1 Tax=Burkholderia cenocepacia TaxID=95486 RepID=UPI003D6635C7
MKEADLTHGGFYAHSPSRDAMLAEAADRAGAKTVAVSAGIAANAPTETVIIDGLDPGWVTVMRYTDYAWRDIPDAWLQRAYLARFKAD